MRVRTDEAEVRSVVLLDVRGTDPRTRAVADPATGPFVRLGPPEKVAFTVHGHTFPCRPGLRIVPAPRFAEDGEVAVVEASGPDLVELKARYGPRLVVPPDVPAAEVAPLAGLRPRPVDWDVRRWRALWEDSGLCGPGGCVHPGRSEGSGVATRRVESAEADGILRAVAAACGDAPPANGLGRTLAAIADGWDLDLPALLPAVVRALVDPLHIPGVHRVDVDGTAVAALDFGHVRHGWAVVVAAPDPRAHDSGTSRTQRQTGLPAWKRDLVAATARVCAGRDPGMAARFALRDGAAVGILHGRDAREVRGRPGAFLALVISYLRRCHAGRQLPLLADGSMEARLAVLGAAAAVAGSVPVPEDIATPRGFLGTVHRALTESPPDRGA